MTNISHELNRIVKLRWLEQLSGSELAFWLVNNFSPEAYNDETNCVEPAIRLLYQKANTELTNEFVARLFGMFGRLPPMKPNVNCGQVVSFRRV